MKVVVGVDDSSCSNAALRHVAEAPWPAGSRFLVVSAVEWPSVTGVGEVISTMAVESLLAEQEKRHRQIAESAAAELRKAGLTVEASSIRGDPRSVLEDVARKNGADLLVVGTHGWTGAKKLLLGSVA